MAETPRLRPEALVSRDVRRGLEDGPDMAQQGRIVLERVKADRTKRKTELADQVSMIALTGTHRLRAQIC